MLDLDSLENERVEAQVDKADLFDFYHQNWSALVAEIRSLREERERRMTLAERILKQGSEKVKEAYS